MMHDRLDLHIQRLGVSRRSSWSALSSQATLLLFTGIALGPQGLALLTPGILAILRPAETVALAVLGVTAAFGSARRGRRSSPWTHVSTTLILMAGLAMALHQRAVTDALSTVAQAASIATLLAGAGWILSSREASDVERRVFSIATFLLLGGLADYLSLSGLLLGWAAAAAWLAARPTGLEEVRLDAAYVQHPVTALLLVTAGARAQLSGQAVLLAAATVCVAMVMMLVLRVRRPGGARAFGGNGVPLTPAAFAVALAMDAARIDPRLATLLSVVVLAAAALDLFPGRVGEDAP